MTHYGTRTMDKNTPIHGAGAQHDRRNLPPAVSTRSIDTDRSYENTAISLLSRAAKAFGVSEDCVSPTQFAQWMLDKQPTWDYATWRLYRAALLHHFSLLAKTTEAKQPYEEASRMIQGALPSACRPRPESVVDRNTSAKRARRISIPDVDKLNTAFMQKAARSKKGWAQATWLFFISTIIAGARPNEWERATMTATGVVVTNSKNTEGREKSEPTRFVPIANVGDYILVQNHIDQIQRWLSSGNSWDLYYKMVREYLRRVVGEVFPDPEMPRISLYTARHQFSSNTIKHNTPEATADLMGHKSVLTHTRHYGSSSFAWLMTDEQRATAERASAETAALPETNTAVEPAVEVNPQEQTQAAPSEKSR